MKMLMLFFRAIIMFNAIGGLFCTFILLPCIERKPVPGILAVTNSDFRRQKNLICIKLTSDIRGSYVP